MKVFRGLPTPESRRPCVLTIGNFDGVHRGHQALLARLRAQADALGLPVCVMTFEPHPREFFNPAAAPARVANLRDKLEGLRACGVDRVIVEHFNARFASLTAQQFIDDIVVGGLHARSILVGDDFRFGAKRQGDFALLQAAGQRQGFAVESLATVQEEGVRISSSAVRAALQAGDLDAAATLLGHPYFISGHVIHGQKLGRTLGYPTLNFRVAYKGAFKRPALMGIFVVQVHGINAVPVPGVASLGMRPTVDDSGRVLLEVHLLDVDQDLYGKLLRVEFLHKLRDEEKYDSLERLKAQIAADEAAARKWFATH
ncbi:MAG: bifunctional riboflavin kinase/FAD synthetase [Burkholderiaceae bacterium]|nr:MAG: bifunctional riboflavin kinase/FAD synthetase [Burkholderiaceae bacterium]